MIQLQTYKIQLLGLARTREFSAFSSVDAVMQWAYSMPDSAWGNGDLAIVVTEPDGTTVTFRVQGRMEFTIV